MALRAGFWADFGAFLWAKLPSYQMGKIVNRCSILRLFINHQKEFSIDSLRTDLWMSTPFPIAVSSPDFVAAADAAVARLAEAAAVVGREWGSGKWRSRPNRATRPTWESSERTWKKMKSSSPKFMNQAILCTCPTYWGQSISDSYYA